MAISWIHPDFGPIRNPSSPYGPSFQPSSPTPEREVSPPGSRQLAQIHELAAQITHYNNIVIALENLAESSTTLESYSSTLGNKAVVSDPSVLSAFVTDTSIPPNTYGISITQLSSAQINNSIAYTSATDTGLIASGSLQIQIGSAAASTFTIDSTTSLTTLAQSIKSANSALYASVVNDGTGYRLQVTTFTGGAANSITFTETDTDLDLEANQIQPAQDAKITINQNMPASSSTNKFVDAISGVTINLLSASAVAQTLSVTADTTDLAAHIQAFVSNYNQVQQAIQSPESASPPSRTSIERFDSTLTNVTHALQNVIALPSANAQGSYLTLMQIGIDSNDDGTLSLDSNLLETAVATDPQSVALLFSNSSDGSISGIAEKIQAISDDYGQADGIIPQLTTAKKTQINGLSKDVLEAQYTHQAYENIRKQEYVDLQVTLSELREQNQLIQSLHRRRKFHSSSMIPTTPPNKP